MTWKKDASHPRKRFSALGCVSFALPMPNLTPREHTGLRESNLGTTGQERWDVVVAARQLKEPDG